MAWRRLRELEPPPGVDEWTASSGARRAIAGGALAALVIAAVLAPVALRLPYLLLPGLLRGAWAFGITWVLMKSIERASGMVGALNAALGISLAALVLLSHHLIFAIHGVPSLGGEYTSCFLFPAQMIDKLIPEVSGNLQGWRWFHPYVLLLITGLPLAVGGGACAKLQSIE